ncbi:MAG: hypothetical protein AAGG80_06710, partial [Pseudomonadota bacterium]
SLGDKLLNKPRSFKVRKDKKAKLTLLGFATSKEGVSPKIVDCLLNHGAKPEQPNYVNGEYKFSHEFLKGNPGCTELYNKMATNASVVSAVQQRNEQQLRQSQTGWRGFWNSIISWFFPESSTSTGAAVDKKVSSVTQVNPSLENERKDNIGSLNTSRSEKTKIESENKQSKVIPVSTQQQVAQENSPSGTEQTVQSKPKKDSQKERENNLIPVKRKKPKSQKIEKTKVETSPKPVKLVSSSKESKEKLTQNSNQKETSVEREKAHSKNEPAANLKKNSPHGTKTPANSAEKKNKTPLQLQPRKATGEVILTSVSFNTVKKQIEDKQNSSNTQISNSNKPKNKVNNNSKANIKPTTKPVVSPNRKKSIQHIPQVEKKNSSTESKTSSQSLPKAQSNPSQKSTYQPEPKLNSSKKKTSEKIPIQAKKDQVSSRNENQGKVSSNTASFFANPEQSNKNAPNTTKLNPKQRYRREISREWLQRLYYCRKGRENLDHLDDIPSFDEYEKQQANNPQKPWTTPNPTLIHAR